MAQWPNGWGKKAAGMLALLCAALLLSGLWMLLRQCNTMGIVSQTDASDQMQQARQWEQQGKP